MEDKNDIEELENLIADTLSDTYGYCHEGWKSHKIIESKKHAKKPKTQQM